MVILTGLYFMSNEMEKINVPNFCCNDELSSMIKRMGITESLRRIWLFSANKTKSSESVGNQPTQLIVEHNSSLWQKLGIQKSSNENQSRNQTWLQTGSF